MADDKPGLGRRLTRYVLVIILLFALAGVATYAVLSDTSIHGLTVRFYNVSWSCTNGTTGPLTFTFGSVVVYSSASLPTSLSHVLFLMSTNGIMVGNATAPNSSFGPGQSVSYPQLSFANSGLDPVSQPTSSLIALTINAQVAAGFYSSPASASYSEVVHFSGPACST
jgi:hypothetical protein